MTAEMRKAGVAGAGCAYHVGGHVRSAVVEEYGLVDGEGGLLLPGEHVEDAGDRLSRLREQLRDRLVRSLRASPRAASGAGLACAPGLLVAAVPAQAGVVVVGAPPSRRATAAWLAQAATRNPCTKPRWAAQPGSLRRSPPRWPGRSRARSQLTVPGTPALPCSACALCSPTGAATAGWEGWALHAWQAGASACIGPWGT